MRADRDPSWVEDLAGRRGFGLTDLSTADHLLYRLAGDLGPAGQGRAWTCEAHRSFLADGGAEDWAVWTCPSLLATGPDRELTVSFGGGGGLGASGDTVVDLVTVGIGAAVGLFRGRRRSTSPQPVADVLSLCDISDPCHVLAGEEVRRLVAHWPVAAEPPAEWKRSVRRALGGVDLPPDAPPQALALGMAMHSPLGVTTRDWWQRPAWLEHQIDLGVTLGRAVVASGAFAP